MKNKQEILNLISELSDEILCRSTTPEIRERNCGAIKYLKKVFDNGIIKPIILQELMMLREDKDTYNKGAIEALLWVIN